jgi:hypothetical protein
MRRSTTAGWSKVTVTVRARCRCRDVRGVERLAEPFPRNVAIAGWTLPAASTTDVIDAVVSFQPIATMLVSPAVSAST